MATLNPLEKKARASFIKGLLISGLIGIIIIALLVLWIFKLNGKEKERIAAQKTVVILKSEVKSGEEITSDMLTTQLANAEVATAGSITMSQFSELSEISDDAGNLIPIKILAKIDIPAKSILTADMISTEEEVVTNDLREQEYNMIVPITNLESGDTIDIRLRLPSGEDYIVISKKKVTLTDLGGVYSTETLLLNVTEEEILTMSAAIVDAYQIAGSKLYATKYTDPGLQSKASSTYVPSQATVRLVDTDPNIVATARNELINRYNNTYAQYRQGVNDALSAIDESIKSSGIESNTESEIATQEAERKTYLESVYGVE